MVEVSPTAPARARSVNYFRAQKTISSGVVEGLNNKAKVTPKILWFSYLPGARTLPISLAWQAA
jgi:hypothetical protein